MSTTMPRILPPGRCPACGTRVDAGCGRCARLAAGELDAREHLVVAARRNMVERLTAAVLPLLPDPAIVHWPRATELTAGPVAALLDAIDAMEADRVPPGGFRQLAQLTRAAVDAWHAAALAWRTATADEQNSASAAALPPRPTCERCGVAAFDGPGGRVACVACDGEAPIDAILERAEGERLDGRLERRRALLAGLRESIDAPPDLGAWPVTVELVSAPTRILLEILDGVDPGPGRQPWATQAQLDAAVRAFVAAWGEAKERWIVAGRPGVEL
jgi:hypothetical protein